MSIIAIAAAVKAAAETAKALQDIYGVLDTDRGVAVTVYNHTPYELHSWGAGFDHGGWADPADQVIPPESASVFSVRDKGFLTGVEGHIFYVVDGVDAPLERVFVKWNNPFVGSNSGAAVASQYGPMDFFGRPSDRFRADGRYGSGNVSQNDYEIRLR
ncbi:hypothetical protein WCD74_13440 [Actinomycetospora sp. OC33-EN08]|uniref:Allene oxide cyclase barrel-like domain-containing protein n=1 Tax=Actinomycetospora aurantiaca TaxID=3129233 RepID=A0ABU8MP57_9PSEU